MARKRTNPGDTPNELTLKDRQYIIKYYDTKSARLIAAYLEKPVPVIQAFIDTLKSESPEPEYEPCSELRALPEWKLYQKQYSPEELTLMEQSYLMMKEQFNEDVLSSERKQALLAIELEIKLHRLKLAEKSLIDNITAIQQFIDDELDKEPEDRDMDRVASFQDQINGNRTALTATGKAQNDILDRHTRIYEKLKLTREQRIDKVAGKVNFLGLLKELDSQQYKNKTMTYMEIGRYAVDLKRAKLYELYTYPDKSVDIPIYNSDSVSNLETDVVIDVTPKDPLENEKDPI
jgi:hypothetical protein